jgi:hypothetical protein
MYLRTLRVCRAGDLRLLRHGTKARIAGCVIARQRPGTAHGFIFLSIEDETGIANAIVDPELYERHRSLVTYSKFLLVEGAVQNVDQGDSYSRKTHRGVECILTPVPTFNSIIANLLGRVSSVIKTHMLVVSLLLSAQCVMSECKLEGPNAVDTAKVFRLRETCSFILFPNESAFFQLSDYVPDIKVILDAERPTGEAPSNLIASVQMLNADGSAMNADQLHMNVIGTHSRSVIAFSFPKARRVGFKVMNEAHRNKLQLTVIRKSDTDFLPLFGRITPGSIEVSQAWDEVLAPNQDSYRMITLPRGAYKVIFDAATARGENTNVQVSVHLLQGDGSGSDSIINMNSIGTSDRASNGFSVKENSNWVLRVVSQNGEHPYRVRVRVVPSED